jgi:hypothetical protein
MDGNNESLDASKRYHVRFEPGQLPPTLANRFWSITMYKADPQFAGNVIDRYAIQDPTPGLVFNADGSLDHLNKRVYLPTAPSLNRATVEDFLPPV